MFQILNFVVFKIAGYLIVQTRFGINKISDSEIEKCILTLDQKNTRSISSKELSSILPADRKKETIDFFKKIHLIRNFPSINFDVSRVIFYSNDSKMQAIFGDFVRKQDSYQNLSITDNPFKNFNDRDLLISFFNPLDWKTIDKIYKSIRETDSIWMLSYPYNKTIFLNNPYKKSWYSPCYKCVKAMIEGNNLSHFFNYPSYQNVIDSLYSQYTDFKVETSLLYTHYLGILNLIIYELENYFMKNDIPYLPTNSLNSSLLNVIEYDPYSRKTSIHTATHWDMCDCYE
ncbi:McbB family protein [Oenococcus oeni]|uniref:McbB family protein n=1 Tax=Oenococcus oeni TaxID=1247 RepID=UPI0010BB9F96|nr:McbB family protein [Oenococcus oeni]SYW14273.1 hypothetical protein OENI_460005 [Oenococcus oeni]